MLRVLTAKLGTRRAGVGMRVQRVRVDRWMGKAGLVQR